MPDFNLAVLSLADLRDLQKSVAKAISTFEARQKAEAREKVEILAKDLGFNLAELMALEEPKRKRTPSTKIYRHPENPTLTWSGRGRKPGWFAARVDAGKDPNELLGCLAGIAVQWTAAPHLLFARIAKPTPCSRSVPVDRADLKVKGPGGGRRHPRTPDAMGGE